MFFPGHHRWKFSSVLRTTLKLIVSLAWAAILPICYIQSSVTLPLGLDKVFNKFYELKFISKISQKVPDFPILYAAVVLLYLVPNVLAALLFVFPMLRRWIENSDWRFVRFFLWWSQVYLFTHCSQYKVNFCFYGPETKLHG